LEKKIEQIKNIRFYLLNQISHLTAKQLNEIPKSSNNNVIWNLAHCISAQQSICYAHAELPIVVDEKYYFPYRPSKKPENFIDSAEIGIIKELFVTSIEQFQFDFEENLFDDYIPWMAKPYGVEISNINDAINFLIYHEGLHAGAIIKLKELLSE